MGISIKQLQVFMATANTGQVSLAAESTFITQSAASMALNQLETLLDAKLFERNGKRLAMNDLGRKLLPKATEILDRVKDFETSAHREALSGNLRIGASKTTGGYWLPPILMAFLKKHSDMNIDYNISNSDEVIKQVLHCETDLGFIESSCNHPKINVSPLKTDELIIVASKKHPLAQKTNVSSQDLVNYNWVMRESGSGTQSLFKNKTASFFKQLKIMIELNEPEAIKKIILSSNALSCLSEEIVRQELETKTLVKLHTPQLTLTRQFNLITLASRYETVLLKTFKEYLKNYLP